MYDSSVSCHATYACAARYQHDFAGVSCRTLSQRYYYQAVTLCPELGELLLLLVCIS